MLLDKDPGHIPVSRMKAKIVTCSYEIVLTRKKEMSSVKIPHKTYVYISDKDMAASVYYVSCCERQRRKLWDIVT